MTRKTVLIIGVGADEYSLAAPFLERDQFQVDRFPSAQRALELIATVSVEILIVRYPLKDMAIDVFLGAVRAPSSPCRSCSLLLLTDDDHTIEAARYLGRGANRIVRLVEAETQVRQLVGEVLEVAPRKAARVAASVKVRMASPDEAVKCQTVNLSTSGMLLDAPLTFPRGTRLEFALRLPDDEHLCTGVARLIRRTRPDREGMAGIALRFISFGDNSKDRLTKFLSTD